jgi:hypothetical protein
MGILLLISLFDSTGAMEVKEFVHLPLLEMKDYTSVVDFDKKYKVCTQQLMSEETVISFPVESCLSLPIYSYGAIRWFETYASKIENQKLGGIDIMRPAYNIEIYRPDITHICAVRGKNNVQKVISEIYFGYNNNPRRIEKNQKIFRGIIFYIRNIGRHNSDHIIAKEADKLSYRLSQANNKYYLNAKGINSKNNLLQQVSEDDYKVMLNPSLSYWPVVENKPKAVDKHTKK